EGLTGEGAVLLCPESAGAVPFPEKGESDPGLLGPLDYDSSRGLPFMADVDGDGDDELLVKALPDRGRQRTGDPEWGFDLSGGGVAALPSAALPGDGRAPPVRAPPPASSRWRGAATRPCRVREPHGVAGREGSDT